MNLRQLEVFRAVIQGGSTKNAAEMLLVSQPAVSNMVRQLEDQLGMALFLRTGGRLRPTREANILYQETAALFHQFEAIQSLADNLRDQSAGQIDFLASPSLGQTIVAQALAGFASDLPGITVAFDTLANEQITDYLLAQRSDFGLTNTFLDHPGLTQRELRRLPVHCILPRGHRLASRDHIAPADLAGEYLISYPRSLPIGLIVDQAFREEGVYQKISMAIRFCATGCAMVEAGTGISFSDTLTLRGGSFPNVVAVPFARDVSTSIVLSHPRQRPLSRSCQTFLDKYLMPRIDALDLR